MFAVLIFALLVPKNLYSPNAAIKTAAMTGTRMRRLLWPWASASVLADEAAAARPDAAGIPAEVDAISPDEPDVRLMRLRSARISAADWLRRSGSFSRDFRITSLSAGGSEGFKSPGSTGLFSRMAWKITADVGPSNGRRPVAIW